MKRYAVFTARFALVPMISGPFVVSATGRASGLEWAHIVSGFAVLYLIFFLLLLSAKHSEVRLPAIAALAIGLVEAIPNVPQLHAAVSPVLFAILAWAVIAAPAGEETAHGKNQAVLFLPALVLLPILYGVRYRHQTSGLMSHLGAALPVAGFLLILCLVLKERHAANTLLCTACNITIGAVLFQVVFGIATLILRMLDLNSGISLAIVRTAHITGAAPVLAASTMLAIQYRRDGSFEHGVIPFADHK
ncbi:MAG TPA: hypothetical protein VG273_19865 [Bryobacteraceae bacterium]|jgi:hypothetical protein|nr:hypothetical protein [Bryobacteraceae bacterium]